MLIALYNKTNNYFCP